MFYIAQKGLRPCGKGLYESTIQGVRVILCELPNFKWVIFNAETGKILTDEFKTLKELREWLYFLNIKFSKKEILTDD